MNDYWKELKLDVLLAPDKSRKSEDKNETEDDVVEEKQEIKSECKKF